MWIARDRNGELWMFKERPGRMTNVWGVEFVEDIITRLPKQIFPEVKWEDAEPRELVLKPIKEDNYEKAEDYKRHLYCRGRQ